MFQTEREGMLQRFDDFVGRSLASHPDGKGKRYTYYVDKIFDVKPTQTEIEAPSKDAKLTLYTCSLGGSSDVRLVLIAKQVMAAN
jgi:sortase A